MEPITPTAAATPVRNRIQRIERGEDGLIRDIEFVDDRGSKARARVSSGEFVCEGRATLWPEYDTELEFAFDYREVPTGVEEWSLLRACARTPKGLEMAYLAARTLVEATVMREAKERCEADLTWAWERVLPPDGKPGGGWITESVTELERWLLDRLPPFEKSAAFGRGAERTARRAWCSLMIEAIHEEQARRMRAAEAEGRGEPGRWSLH